MAVSLCLVICTQMSWPASTAKPKPHSLKQLMKVLLVNLAEIFRGKDQDTHLGAWDRQVSQVDSNLLLKGL